jgi:hypothetical protein
METDGEPTTPQKQYFSGNLESPLSTCIVIASHISNPKRIDHLMECLASLMEQTVVIPVYLSISFETEHLNLAFAEEFITHPEFHNELIYLYVKTEKTPQMRHINDLYPVLKQNYHWMMFCDDDDTYHPKRVETFIHYINHLTTTLTDPTTLTGIYESPLQKDHKERRHEYWCYCVRLSIFERFMNIITQYPDVLDNKCCDVLFAEFLRRLHPRHVFGYTTDLFYNYRVEDNTDSITGVIQLGQKQVRPARQDIDDSNAAECANELDEYLNENLRIYLHDTFLYSIVGSSFDDVLRQEFKTEYGILSMINQEHIEKMRTLHTSLRAIANELYDIKLQ